MSSSEQKRRKDFTALRRRPMVFGDEPLSSRIHAIHCFSMLLSRQSNVISALRVPVETMKVTRHSRDMRYASIAFGDSPRTSAQYPWRNDLAMPQKLAAPHLGSLFCFNVN